MHDNNGVPGPVSVAGIGDLTSTAKGTAARFNGGKANLELIPVWIIADAIPIQRDTKRGLLHSALIDLGEFQKTQNTEFLRLALRTLQPFWSAAAEVFDYGRKKYAEWNWTKGMAWSAVIGSALRHAEKNLIKGEDNDAESGLSHLGHFMCNLVMLRQFVESYPEGNDLPSPDLFKEA